MAQTTSIAKRFQIDFHEIARVTGARRGKLAHSAAFNSWAVFGSDQADCVLFDAPYQIGKELDGGIIESVKVEGKEWVVTIQSVKEVGV